MTRVRFWSKQMFKKEARKVTEQKNTGGATTREIGDAVQLNKTCKLA